MSNAASQLPTVSILSAEELTAQVKIGTPYIVLYDSEDDNLLYERYEWFKSDKAGQHVLNFSKADNPLNGKMVYEIPARDLEWYMRMYVPQNVSNTGLFTAFDYGAPELSS